MYNVMIVEDDPMARRLLEIMVTSDESYHLAVSVESASVAEVYCMTEAIDLILMDVCPLSMPADWMQPLGLRSCFRRFGLLSSPAFRNAVS